MSKKNIKRNKKIIIDNENNRGSMINDFSNSLDKLKEMKRDNREMNNVNMKLLNNYKMSLKIMGEMSEIMNKYREVFKKMVDIMNNLENNLKFTKEDLELLSRISDNNVTKYRNKFNEQTNNVYNVLKEEGYEDLANDIEKFRNNDKELIETKNKALSIIKSRRSENAGRNSSPSTVSSKDASIQKPKSNEGRFRRFIKNIFSL